MEQQRHALITGSGSYIPTLKVTNEDFLSHTFYGPDGTLLQKSGEEIIRQFELITGIRERRYLTDDLVASDMAYFAARDALGSAAIDPETLDYIIVADNFGDIRAENRRSEQVPSLAARVKHHLGIVNPQTICYDLPFGCAGWLQAVIQADGYIRSGEASQVLVIGAETLSRICDPHDRDSMLYADGAGAVIISAAPAHEAAGILAHLTRSYGGELAYLLQMGRSSNPAYPEDTLFLKMQGRKLYEQALKFVPLLISDCIAKAGLSIGDIDQVLIHQANQKMDEAILKQLYVLYDLKQVPDHLMPMTISWLGNSSVATLPTLYDLLSKGEIPHHRLPPGRTVVFVSVGAGLNMNAVVYQIPQSDHHHYAG
ncbi:3-oxoacyl-[acyl-carrier-protein] synthase-3 [Mucilaginibacter pineti]|uniref:3-oxoacyl-[acyl-carrier-protein] synthase-3 n=1 Tax=Mucilaginibacter pineti TaxID=1391627 RepID=A0A1G7JLF1_9SPHI|nr:ketoacyl-ACP synthase III [Mucilaginibacter pineti]SDF25685.1 3-oxoacyl-[acyl-carrier-protein] synthase-3 [Mucilaginibacter pineti]